MAHTVICLLFYFFAMTVISKNRSRDFFVGRHWSLSENQTDDRSSSSHQADHPARWWRNTRSLSRCSTADASCAPASTYLSGRDSSVVCIPSTVQTRYTHHTPQSSHTLFCFFFHKNNFEKRQIKRKKNKKRRKKWDPHPTRSRSTATPHPRSRTTTRHLFLHHRKRHTPTSGSVLAVTTTPPPQKRNAASWNQGPKGHRHF